MKIEKLVSGLREDIGRFGLFVFSAPLLLLILFGRCVSKVNMVLIRFYLSILKEWSNENVA